MHLARNHGVFGNPVTLSQMHLATKNQSHRVSDFEVGENQGVSRNPVISAIVQVGINHNKKLIFAVLLVIGLLIVARIIMGFPETPSHLGASVTSAESD